MGGMHKATAFLIVLAGAASLLPGCAQLAGHCPLQTASLAPTAAERAAHPAPASESAPAVPAPDPAPQFAATLPPDIPCLWPVQEDDRCILSGYGPRGWRRGGPGQFHRAVDIRASVNAPVVAAAAGTVKQAMRQGDYGNILVIDHGNGYESAYAHLNAMLAKEGQQVARGELIARAGRTGNATAPHVHYEIRHDGQAINPTPYLPMGGAVMAAVPAEPPKPAPAPEKKSLTRKPSERPVKAKASTAEQPTAKASARASGKKAAANTSAKKDPAKPASKTSEKKETLKTGKTNAATTKKAAAKTEDKPASKTARKQDAGKKETSKTADKTAAPKSASKDGARSTTKKTGAPAAAAPKKTPLKESAPAKSKSTLTSAKTPAKGGKKTSEKAARKP